MVQVFISYAHEDFDFAQLVKYEIEKRGGFTVWIDDLTPEGEDWRKEIDEAIRQSQALLLVMTEHAHDSEYVIYEWAFARGAGKTIIPLLRQRLEDQNMHAALTGLQAIDFTGRNRPWDRLHQRLEQLVGIKSEDEWESLLSSLRSTKRDMRMEAIKRLTRINNPDDLELVVGILFGGRYNRDVRRAAIRALGNMGEDALPYLLQAMADRDKDVRFEAGGLVAALGDMAVPPLLQLLENINVVDVRRRTAWVLGEIGQPAAVPALVDLLGDKRSTPDYRKRVSDAAADALMEIGDEKGLKAIENYWVRELSNTKEHWKGRIRICDYAAQMLEQVGTSTALAAVESWQKSQGH